MRYPAVNACTIIPMPKSRGKIIRVVNNSIAYASVIGTGTLSFTPSVLTEYRGESFSERGIDVGAFAEIEWGEDSGAVLRVSTLAEERPLRKKAVRRGQDSFRSKEADVPILEPTRARSSPGTIQKELHPDNDPSQSAACPRALPPATRKFGKLVETASLKPGDLLLSRELKPDRISSTITDVQSVGGYADADARWTHAAMYVGDGQNILEATFDSLTSGGDVRLTSFDEYCQGVHALRFRRSRFLQNHQEGWVVCVRAMSRLKQPYDFGSAIRMWIDVVLRGRDFSKDHRRRSTSQAVVCSTLYSDSYNEATRRRLGEIGGACVPAWLSVSDEFEDVGATWSSIG